MGYSPWGHKESDRTEGLTLPLFHTSCIYVRYSEKLSISLKMAWWKLFTLNIIFS